MDTVEKRLSDIALLRTLTGPDWMGPIYGVIHAAQYDRMREIVTFYTATELRVLRPLPDGRIVVAAGGYRMGPAGDW